MKDAIIWTNHALKRQRERKISNNLIIRTIAHPDKITPIKKNAFEYKKYFGRQTLYAVIKINEEKQKIVVSCWINPANPGTKDFRRAKRYIQMKHASFLKRLWLQFLYNLGI